MVTTYQATQARIEHERRMKMAEIAAKDPIKFAQFCFRSEKTGGLLVSEREHYRMMEFIEQNRHCVIMASPKLGKSTFVTKGRSLFRLGQDPNRYRAKIYSATKTNASRHLVAIRQEIETNENVRLVFPGLRRGKLWTDEAFTVERHGVILKEPSMWACGDGSGNQGFRSNDDFFDDMVDTKNSLSAYQMRKLKDYVMQNTSRVESGGSRIFVQNCFRDSDTGWLLHREEGWALFQLKAIDEEGRTLFPVLWPQHEVDAYAPSMRDQDLRCIPQRDGDSIFRNSYIELAKSLGEGRPVPYSIDRTKLPEGVTIVTGVDPSGGKNHSQGDMWAMVTLLAGPPSYFGLDYEPTHTVSMVLDVQSGRFSAPVAMQHIRDLKKRYNPDFVVESNGVQDWIRQIMAVTDSDISIAPFETTARSKHALETGFQSLATRMSQGLLVFPSVREQSSYLACDAPFEQVLMDMKKHDPKGHHGDRLMALWFADVIARKRSVRDVGVPLLIAGQPLTMHELMSEGLTREEAEAYLRGPSPDAGQFSRRSHLERLGLTDVAEEKEDGDGEPDTSWFSFR